MQQITPDGPPCTGCRRPLRAGARFCTSCGTPVGGPAAESTLGGAPITVVQDAQPEARRRARPTEQAPVLATSFGLAAPAGLGRRLAAFTVDLAATAAVAAGVWFGTGHVLYPALAVVELGIGLTVWEARTGRTLGNSLFGLRTARVDAPYNVGPRRAFLRALPLAGGYLVAGVGEWAVVASAGFDRTGRNQGWHDRAGRAVVVDIRAQERAVIADEEALAQAMSAPADAYAARPAAPRTAGAAGQSGVATVAVGQQVGATTAATPGGRPAMTPVSRPSAPAAGQPNVPQTAHLASPSAPTTGQPGVSSAASTGLPAPTPAANPPGMPTLHILTLDTGVAMSVTGPGVIGRAPQPIPGEPCDHVVTIEDPERSVSRTHARFGMDEGRFWVQDAGSGNGTTLQLPDGRVVPVPVDQRVAVPAGSTIQVGARSVHVD
ncbi:FHA domain-containing protein [Cellulomonas sp. NPDC089187]|uniref:RDD family protein n=1 Tax=Cellulomonas sp. NPDC089187 TaxID=3154970 RepID=UPI0034277137